MKAQANVVAWLGFCEPGLSLTGVWVKDLRNMYNPMIVSTSAALPGTGAATPLSQGTAMVVTARTLYSGRGWVGRAYLMGMDQSVLLTARTFSSAVGTAGINFMNAINTVVSPLLGPLVVAQRELQASTVPGAPPPYNTIRTAAIQVIQKWAIANNRVDSQRRRLGSG